MPFHDVNTGSNPVGDAKFFSPVPAENTERTIRRESELHLRKGSRDHSDLGRRPSYDFGCVGDNPLVGRRALNFGRSFVVLSARTRGGDASGPRLRRLLLERSM